MKDLTGAVCVLGKWEFKEKTRESTDSEWQHFGR